MIKFYQRKKKLNIRSIFLRAFAFPHNSLLYPHKLLLTKTFWLKPAFVYTASFLSFLLLRRNDLQNLRLTNRIITLLGPFSFLLKFNLWHASISFADSLISTALAIFKTHFSNLVTDSEIPHISMLFRRMYC